MLRNRLIAAPIDVHVSREKAASGVSLIVLGDGFVTDDANGRIWPHSVNAYATENLLKTKEKLEFWRQLRKPHKISSDDPAVHPPCGGKGLPH